MLELVFSFCAASFAYLGWVRMVNPNRGDVQRELFQRITQVDAPADTTPPIYPSGVTIMESNAPLYKLKKNCLPYQPLEGHVEIDITVYDQELINLFRLRKDAFSGEAAYSGCTVDDPENPRNITLVFDSIHPQRIQSEVSEIKRALRGGYQMVLPDEIEPRDLWDRRQEAPDPDIRVDGY